MSVGSRTDDARGLELLSWAYRSTCSSLSSDAQVVRSADAWVIVHSLALVGWRARGRPTLRDRVGDPSTIPWTRLRQRSVSCSFELSYMVLVIMIGRGAIMAGELWESS